MLLARRILSVGLFIIISLHPPHATPNNQANFSDLQLKPAGQGTWVPLASSHFVPVNRPKAARFEYFGFFFFKGLEDLITNKKLQIDFPFILQKKLLLGRGIYPCFSWSRADFTDFSGNVFPLFIND